MTLATIVALAAGEAEHHGNVQAETFIYGVIAFALFLLLGLVTVSVDTAGASTFTYPEIVDLEAEPGRDLLQTLYTRFQDYFSVSGFEF